MMENAAYKLAESVELQAENNEIVERKRKRATRTSLAGESKDSRRIR